MVIDKAGFLALTAALAGGGVAGYLIRDRAVPPRTVVVTEAKAPVVATPPPTEADRAKVEALEKAEEKQRAKLAAAAQCDDSVGAAAECPAMPASTDEGMCGVAVSRRCADFKAAFKPKVAESAVACLRSLKGAELCDPARVNLCGHQALMSACQEPMPDEFFGATSTKPATFTKEAEPLKGIAAQCDSIVKSCGGSAPATSYADCMQTLAGMNDAGRTSAMSCMKLHCGNKGFLGCEAAPAALTSPTPAIQ